VNERVIAYSQVGLTVLFFGCYFFVLYAFMDGRVRVPADFRDAFMALLGVITANLGQIISYFFARQRPNSGGEV
jgi:uncharacterized YccA/Bax inhibitor family protein